MASAFLIMSSQSTFGAGTVYIAFLLGEMEQLFTIAAGSLLLRNILRKILMSKTETLGSGLAARTYTFLMRSRGELNQCSLEG